jgi:hypothetical protein
MNGRKRAARTRNGHFALAARAPTDHYLAGKKGSRRRVGAVVPVRVQTPQGEIAGEVHVARSLWVDAFEVVFLPNDGSAPHVMSGLELDDLIQALEGKSAFAQAHGFLVAARADLARISRTF